MLPFLVTLVVAGVAVLLWFLGRQMNNGTLKDAGFIIGVLNTPLLAFLLRGLLTLALVIGALALTIQPVGAYNGSVYVSANCQGPAYCTVVFAANGGSDNYDCWSVRLWKSNGAYSVHNFCNSTGWGQSVQFYVPPGQFATVFEILYHDGVGHAYSICDSWA